jgi:hypothetical protein
MQHPILAPLKGHRGPVGSDDQRAIGKQLGQQFLTAVLPGD